MLGTILRTPDERFAHLPGYPFAPHYVQVDGLRMHYVDEGPASGEPVLLLHGEPSWSYLYRTMIPVLAAAGLRAIAPDLIGFGRSDKPANRAEYTYQRHVEWMRAFVGALDLRGVTLVCQDWGGFIIPLTWGEQTDWFRNVRAAGSGVLHWRGARYTLVRPEIVAGPEARSAFHPLERGILKLGGVRFVHLHQPTEHEAEQHAIPLSER